MGSEGEPDQDVDTGSPEEDVDTPRTRTSTPASPDDGAGLHRPVAPVLGMSLAILAVSPFLTEAAGRVVTTALIGGTALVALRRSQARRTTLLLGESLVVVATAAAIASREIGSTDDALTTLSTATLCLLLLITPAVIVFRLALRPRITLDSLAGALAAYIQIGLFFASLYRLLDLAGNQAFFAGLDNPSAMDFQFFSFVTLTTLGYGNLVPGTDIGETLAVFEALLGQVFLVTVVALAVGNLGSAIPRTNRPGPDAADTGAQATPR